MGAVGPLLVGGGGTADPKMSLVSMTTTPQQANGHDCGLYTIAIAEALCEGLASDKLPAALGAIPARVAALTPTKVDGKRAALKQLVAA